MHTSELFIDSLSQVISIFPRPMENQLFIFMFENCKEPKGDLRLSILLNLGMRCSI